MARKWMIRHISRKTSMGTPFPMLGEGVSRGSMEWLGKNWQRPDEGYMGVRGGGREFLHSRFIAG